MKGVEERQEIELRLLPIGAVESQPKTIRPRTGIDVHCKERRGHFVEGEGPGEGLLINHRALQLGTNTHTTANHANSPTHFTMRNQLRL